jgi:hypothetical protein
MTGEVEFMSPEAWRGKMLELESARSARSTPLIPQGGSKLT